MSIPRSSKSKSPKLDLESLGRLKQNIQKVNPAGTTSIKRPLFGYEEKKKNQPRPRPRLRVLILLTTFIVFITSIRIERCVWYTCRSQVLIRVQA